MLIKDYRVLEIKFSLINSFQRKLFLKPYFYIDQYLVEFKRFKKIFF